MQQGSSNPSSPQAPKTASGLAWGSPTSGSWGSPAAGSWGSPAPRPRNEGPAWSTPVSAHCPGQLGGQRHPPPRPPHMRGSLRGQGFSPRGGSTPPFRRGSWNSGQTSDSPSLDASTLESSACLDSSDSWNSSAASLVGQSPLGHNQSFPGASAARPNYRSQGMFHTPQPAFQHSGEEGSKYQWKNFQRNQPSTGEFLDERALNSVTSDPWNGLEPMELHRTPAAPRTRHTRFESAFKC